MWSAARLLSGQGPFAEQLPGYQARDAQQEMADAVEQAIFDGGDLICEAGTGIGKTFAYLVPLLMSGKRALVSTGTRNLQDQLFRRDLPLVREILACGGDIALLKGRSNYLCPQRLQRHRAQPERWDASIVDSLERVAQWQGGSSDGDLAELGELAEDRVLHPLISSTVDNCQGRDCAHLPECPVYLARQRAQQANLVVVNHHLLCADLALKDEGVAELLPEVDAVVIDEAHQLPEIAAAFFGINTSTRRLQDLLRDVRSEYQEHAKDTPILEEAADMLELALKAAQRSLGKQERKGDWSAEFARNAVRTAFEGMDYAFGSLCETLYELSVRSQGLARCSRRAEQQHFTLTQFLQTGEEGDVSWFECGSSGFTLHRTPLYLGDAFHQRLAAVAHSRIYTSATLSVGEDFSFFCRRLGLEDARTLQLASPFDYAAQAMLYLPKAMPDPRDAGHTAAVVEIAKAVIQASGGRAFLLFTSHRALQEAHRALDGQLDYPLLVQGEASANELLERFRRLGNAILLGTGSFWEGVDVRGDALSAVVIDKLPFAAPDDPLLQARVSALKSEGYNPFMHYQVPEAVIALKQGVGRLIRDTADRGVLVICDQRLSSKGYGKVFLRSLPPMMPAQSIAEVRKFFQEETVEKALPDD